MIERQTDLWSIESEWKVITTNGFVKKDGKAVMGRGCAQEAERKFPNLPDALGSLIMVHGNVVNNLGWYSLDNRRFVLFSFPVKHNWWEKADLGLIERSALALKILHNAVCVV